MVGTIVDLGGAILYSNPPYVIPMNVALIKVIYWTRMTYSDAVVLNYIPSISPIHLH